MYTRFFGLQQEPFSLAPDPRYLYMSKRHREALAHLLYGVGGGGGFVLLSGEIGAGKTTVCRCFLEQIPKRTNVAYIFNPKLTVIELLKTICDEFRIPYSQVEGREETVKRYVDPLNEFLLKTHSVGQNNILIIDEAQMLSVDVLEQLRLLTNLETNERKLLQIVLIGQPELRTMLERPELEQLAQRVIARFHLKALSEVETEHYIRHRLSVAGLTRGLPFDRKALRRIHEIARGVPRRINLLCDRVMLGAYGHNRHSIDLAMIDKAALEVFGKAEAEVGDSSPASQRKAKWIVVSAGVLLLGVASFAGYGLWRQANRPEAPVLAKASATPTLAVATAPGSAAATASGTASSIAPTRIAASAPAASSVAASAPMAALPPAAAGPASAAASAPVSSIVSVAARSSLPAASPINVPQTLDPAGVAAFLKGAGHDEKAAWQELVPLWKLAGTAEGGDACAAAAREQMRCSRFPASLALLRSLDRPGLVSLRDDAGRAVPALLLGLGSESVLVQSKGMRASLPLGQFSKRWQGEFSTLWRLPEGYVTVLAEGASGPAVDHLAAALARAASQSAPGGKRTMDAALRSQVARFQTSHGLPAIGKAGPTTFMQLNRATGVDEPRLVALPPAA